MNNVEIIKMTTNYKSLAFLLVCTVSNSLSAQTAEFDTTSGYLTIPLLKLGADVYEQVRFQYDGELDFNVVDYAKKTESDAKTNATFDGSTLNLKVVKVGEAVYSNLEFKFKPDVLFSITEVTEPQKLSTTSLGNKKSEEWLNIRELTKATRNRYKEEFNSSVYSNIVSAFIDIDQDGDDDLFVVPSFYPATGAYTQDNYGKVPGQLWINDGIGNFMLNVNDGLFDKSHFEHGRKVVTADFNGDLLPDIVVADHGFDADPFPGGELHVILSNIDGSYSKGVTSISGFHHGVSAGDFDNDGDIDLYSVATVGGGLLLNDGNGKFSSSEGVKGFRERKNKIYNSVSGDLDLDGLADILVMGESWVTKPTILYQENDGFVSVELPYRQSYRKFLDADFADLNDDGNLDIIFLATGGDEQGKNRYKGIGLHAVLMTENRTPGQVIDLYYDDSYTEQWFPFVRAQDINADGYVDIVSEDKYYNFLLLGQGGGIFEKKYAFVSPDFESWDIKTDINNDGYLDALTTESNAAPATITYGSDIEFVEKNERYLELESIPDFSKTWKFAVGDLNSDGNSDLVATATNTSTGLNVGCAVGIHFLVGKQLERYETIYSNQDSGSCYEAKVADIDYDGDLDITTQINGGAKLNLINDGEGGFTLLE